MLTTFINTHDETSKVRFTTVGGPQSGFFAVCLDRYQIKLRFLPRGLQSAPGLCISLIRGFLEVKIPVYEKSDYEKPPKIAPGYQQLQELVLNLIKNF